jgi:hypothetical protein
MRAEKGKHHRKVHGFRIAQEIPQLDEMISECNNITDKLGWSPIFSKEEHTPIIST